MSKEIKTKKENNSQQKSRVGETGRHKIAQTLYYTNAKRLYKSYHDNQLKIDKNRKGRVAQRIELLSHSGEDVSSKLLRKSRHAREHLEKNKSNRRKKEKWAYSQDKNSLSLRGISHEFESIVESNQSPQHIINKANIYINLSNFPGLK